MNQQAVPVLIMFMTVAGLAVWLLRRAFASLAAQRSGRELIERSPSDEQSLPVRSRQ